MRKRLTIGISGASGSIYAVRLIKALPEIELHIIASDTAREIMEHELGFGIETITGAENIVLHENDDLFAPVASGSFESMGMVIIPCSMKTLSAVANGYAAGLIERAADVTLKEGRPLIVVPRETPYNLIHLENMSRIAKAGGIIMSASPGFYNRPKTIDDLVDFMTGRILDRLGIENTLSHEWKGR